MLPIPGGHSLALGAQDIGLYNHKVKSALSVPYDDNARPSQTDRRTSWQ